MKTMALILSSLLFVSCMHLGMHSMEGHQASANPDPIVEKEMTLGDLRAVATFPPMIAGEEEVLTLRLSGAINQKPVTGAEVQLRVQPIEEEAADNQHSMPGHGEPEADRTAEWSVRETINVPGTYTVSYGQSKTGSWDVAFHVSAINGKKLDPELIIGKRIVVKEEAMDHSGGMMGSSGTWNMLLIMGGIVMVGMMVFMFIH